MKKNLLCYLFAALCGICLFIACDDDDDVVISQVEQIVGTYTGDMEIHVNGVEVADNVKTSATITKESDSSVEVTLLNVTIPNYLNTPTTLKVTCDATLVGNNYRLSGDSRVIIIDGNPNLNVTLTGTADHDDLDMKYFIQVAGATAEIEFDGKK